MKSIIKSALVFALALTVSNGKAVETVYTSSGASPVSEKFSSARPIIKVKVVFGKGDNCTGKGICSIIITTGWDVNSNASFNIADRTLTLDVAIAEVETNQPEQVANLQVPRFQVDEDYTLSDDVCKELGIPSGYVIKAGSYPLTVAGDRRVIVFGEF